jgi:hypothetical protein
MNEFVFQVFQVGIIKVKTSLEGTIGDSSLAFQKVKDLGENVIKGHDRYPAISITALLRRSMPQNGSEGKDTNKV